MEARQVDVSTPLRCGISVRMNSCQMLTVHDTASIMKPRAMSRVFSFVGFTPCPSRVKSGSRSMSASCPLYPRKRTLIGTRARPLSAISDQILRRSEVTLSAKSGHDRTLGRRRTRQPGVIRQFILRRGIALLPPTSHPALLPQASARIASSRTTLVSLGPARSRGHNIFDRLSH
jgi:hypothetical protein